MKIFIAAMLTILLHNAAAAQTKLGIKITPSVISQRIANPSDNTGFYQPAPMLSFPMMAIADIRIGKNCFFASGLGYISRRMRLEMPDAPVTPETIDLRIQYLQIPVTLKLLTDEIAIDKRLYCQFGPAIEFKLHDKLTQGSLPEDLAVAGGQFTMLFAAGINMLVSPNTIVEIGVNYSRGLTNIFENTSMSHGIPDVRSDLFGLDLVVKF